MGNLSLRPAVSREAPDEQDASKAALERRESEGFVSVGPQLGSIVREMAVQEIADQFEIRLALESYVLCNIAGKLKEFDTQAFERIFCDRSWRLMKETFPPLSSWTLNFMHYFVSVTGIRKSLESCRNFARKHTVGSGEFISVMPAEFKRA